MGKRYVRVRVLAIALFGGLLLPVIGWSGPSPAVLEYRHHMFDPPVRMLVNRKIELMFDTVRVEPGSGTWKLAAKPTALDFTYEFDGKVQRASDVLENTYTDALLIIKNGVIVHEAYLNRAHERTHFMSYSMAKSLNSIMMGFASDPDAERSRKIVLISRIKPKHGTERDIEAAIREFYVAVRRFEPGCLINTMHRASAPPAGPKTDSNGSLSVLATAPATLVFYEVYRDQAAAGQHTSTPHFRTLMSRIGDLIDGKIELEFLQELDSVSRVDGRIASIDASSLGGNISDNAAVRCGSE